VRPTYAPHMAQRFSARWSRSSMPCPGLSESSLHRGGHVRRARRVPPAGSASSVVQLKACSLLPASEASPRALSTYTPPDGARPSLGTRPQSGLPACSRRGPRPRPSGRLPAAALPCASAPSSRLLGPRRPCTHSARLSLPTQSAASGAPSWVRRTRRANRRPAVRPGSGAWQEVRQAVGSTGSPACNSPPPPKCRGHGGSTV